MDLLNGNIKPIYFKYLSAAFGSALITSVYSVADMAIVGQYHGPDGTATIVADPDTIWFAMPITELFIAIYVITMIFKYTKELPREEYRI